MIFSKFAGNGEHSYGDADTQTCQLHSSMLSLPNLVAYLKVQIKPSLGHSFIWEEDNACKNYAEADDIFRVD